MQLLKRRTGKCSYVILFEIETNTIAMKDLCLLQANREDEIKLNASKH